MPKYLHCIYIYSYIYITIKTNDMKTLSIYDAVNYIGSLPGDTQIRVFYSFVDGQIIIVEDTNKDYFGGASTPLICSGQPEKFFNALHTALFQMVTRND